MIAKIPQTKPIAAHAPADRPLLSAMTAVVMPHKIQVTIQNTRPGVIVHPTDQRRGRSPRQPARVPPRRARRRARSALPGSCRAWRGMTAPGGSLWAQWSLTTLREKLVKIGARIVRHGRYVVFQLAEVAVARTLLAEIPRRIERLRLRPPPLPA
jgi:hypothetical protein